MEKQIMVTSPQKYSRRINKQNPGLIIILIDQSQSMEDNNKAVTAALAVNQTIYEIILASQSGTEIKDRCEVGVLGYGENVSLILGGTISHVNTIPIDVQKVVRKVLDNSGNFVSVEEELPIWVKPTAQNGTPMARALVMAHQIALKWTKDHANSFPPVVINITDGEPADFKEVTGRAPETEEAARRLLSVSTNDGELLLFNAHISGMEAMEVLLPASEEDLLSPYARMLFRISSLLPAALIGAAQKVGMNPAGNARGFIFNAGVESLIKLLTFGSSSFSTR